jgi:putative iron-dependent peroxidase
VPCGSVTDDGTMFVGFAADQRPLADLHESLTGRLSGGRDALTRYTGRSPARTTSDPQIESLPQVTKRLN